MACCNSWDIFLLCYIKGIFYLFKWSVCNVNKRVKMRCSFLLCLGDLLTIRYVMELIWLCDIVLGCHSWKYYAVWNVDLTSLGGFALNVTVFLISFESSMNWKPKMTQKYVITSPGTRQIKKPKLKYFSIFNVLVKLVLLPLNIKKYFLKRKRDIWEIFYMFVPMRSVELFPSPTWRNICFMYRYS